MGGNGEWEKMGERYIEWEGSLRSDEKREEIKYCEEIHIEKRDSSLMIETWDAVREVFITLCFCKKLTVV